MTEILFPMLEARQSDHPNANDHSSGQSSRPARAVLPSARLATFLDAALQKDIDLGFDISPSSVIGLPWLLQEALANLIDNAIRYTPCGGIITVRCGETAEYAFLEVEDDGPGIAEELTDKVFERFYRIPGSTSNGCGLGLPIVKEIVEFHGAALRLIRREPNGLRVRLEFPKKR